MKIALVRLTSLGDIILCMAVLQVIRRHIPDCHITWVVDKRYANILDNNPDIQQIISVDLKELKKKRSPTALLAEYRRLSSFGSFDAIIDLHGLLKSAIVAAVIGGTRRYGFSRQTLKEPLASIFYDHRISVALDMPSVCRYAMLSGKSLGFDFMISDLCRPKPYLFWRDEDNIITDKYFAQNKKNILFVPETSAGYKNYPPEKFAHLAAMLGENILICHGNQREFNTASAIAEKQPNVRVLPQLNLNQLKAAIGRCDLVIGGDSGPTHIAWACGTPSITLFGATPVCICPTEINKIIKTKSQVNLRKPDANDFTVSNISVDDIVQLVQQLWG